MVNIFAVCTSHHGFEVPNIWADARPYSLLANLLH